MQKVFHGPSFYSGLSEDKSFLCDTRESPLPVGQDVEMHIKDVFKKLRTPAASIEHHGQAPVRAAHRANFLEDGNQHVGHSGIGFCGDDKERVTLLVIDPIIRCTRRGDSFASYVGLGYSSFAVILANMPIDI